MLKKIFFGILLVLVIAFVGIFMYGMAHSTSAPPPPPPNWNDPNIKLMIIRENDNYLLSFGTSERRGAYFIGNSKIDLEPFVGLDIKVKGKLPMTQNDEIFSNDQCIVSLCHKIVHPKFWEEQNQNAIVVDIDEITVITPGGS